MVLRKRKKRVLDFFFGARGGFGFFELFLAHMMNFEDWER